MTVRILTIPPETDRWPTWLEEQLVDVHLHDLVAELQMMRDAEGLTDDPVALQSLLSTDELTAIAERGLRELGTRALQDLFRNPESLFELQDHILIHGSSYWDSVHRSAESLQAAERVSTAVAARPTDVSPPARHEPDQQPTRRNVIFWLTSVVAVALIAVAVLQNPGTGFSGRILGRRGLITNDVGSSQEYFERLGNAGMEWFEFKSKDRTQLVTLLQEVSSDCQLLIEAEHQVLSAAERARFVDKCTKWKQKIDVVLAQLQSGELSLKEAEEQADAIMLKLSQALQAGLPA